MKRCVVIGGAPIGDVKRIKSLLDPKNDFYLFCDGGLRYAAALGVHADLIVGDFDSYKKPKTEVETIVLPTVKDDTDTVFAVKEALARGFDEFLLIGVTGGRLDHTLGNVAILLYLDSLGKKGVISDELSDMCIVSDTETVDKAYPFFSLINIDGKADGITVTGAKYNLENARITPEYQYGVSNEVVSECATVTVSDGRLLLIKVVEDVNKKSVDYWHLMC